MQQIENNEQYKGYSLFSDVEDAALRAHNRGVVMANVLEENLQVDLDNPLRAIPSVAATAAVLGYFNAIPALERRVAHDAFTAELTKRGIRYGAK